MTTSATRREELGSELTSLLEQMRTHPSRDWSGTKERAFILGRMLARQPAAPQAGGRPRG